MEMATERPNAYKRSHSALKLSNIQTYSQAPKVTVPFLAAVKLNQERSRLSSIKDYYHTSELRLGASSLKSARIIRPQTSNRMSE